MSFQDFDLVVILDSGYSLEDFVSLFVDQLSVNIKWDDGVFSFSYFCSFAITFYSL